MRFIKDALAAFKKLARKQMSDLFQFRRLLRGMYALHTLQYRDMSFLVFLFSTWIGDSTDLNLSRITELGIAIDTLHGMLPEGAPEFLVGADFLIGHCCWTSSNNVCFKDTVRTLFSELLKRIGEPVASQLTKIQADHWVLLSHVLNA